MINSNLYRHKRLGYPAHKNAKFTAGIPDGFKLNGC